MIVPLIPIAILIDDRCQDLSYAYNMPDNFSWGHEKLSGTVRMATTKQMKQVVHRLASNIDRVGWPSGHGALDTNPSFPPEYLLPFPWVPVLASSY